jgi:uncharacterized protein YdaU (DUF1376 family)
MNEDARATDEVRIWMPFYCADTLAETVRLTTRQFGAYVFLMIEYWLTGPLPNDDAILRQITRLERSEWKHDGQVLKACFPEGSDGKLYKLRIDDLKMKALEIRRSAKERSQKANAARWSRKRDDSAPSPAPSIPPRTPKGILEGSSSTSPPKSTSKNTGTGNRDPAPNPEKKKANGKSDDNPPTESGRYAKAMFERLHIPAGEKLMARAAEAIRLNAADCNVTEEESAALIEQAAREAQARGEIIKPWWFEDRKYKVTHQVPLAESVQGMQRNNSAGAADERRNKGKIVEYLKHCSLELQSKSAGLGGLHPISEDLWALVEAADTDEIECDFVSIEEKLKPMDQRMFSVLESAAGAEKIAKIKAEVRADQGARWGRMNDEGRRAVERQGIFKRLHELFQLPRLSLVYMDSYELARGIEARP